MCLGSDESPPKATKSDENHSRPGESDSSLSLRVRSLEELGPMERVESSECSPEEPVSLLRRSEGIFISGIL